MSPLSLLHRCRFQLARIICFISADCIVGGGRWWEIFGEEEVQMRRGGGTRDDGWGGDEIWMSLG